MLNPWVLERSVGAGRAAALVVLATAMSAGVLVPAREAAALSPSGWIAGWPSAVGEYAMKGLQPGWYEMPLAACRIAPYIGAAECTSTEIEQLEALITNLELRMEAKRRQLELQGCL